MRKVKVKFIPKCLPSLYTCSVGPVPPIIHYTQPLFMLVVPTKKAKGWKFLCSQICLYKRLVDLHFIFRRKYNSRGWKIFMYKSVHYGMSVYLSSLSKCQLSSLFTTFCLYLILIHCIVYGERQTRPLPCKYCGKAVYITTTNPMNFLYTGNRTTIKGWGMKIELCLPGKSAAGGKRTLPLH